MSAFTLYRGANSSHVLTVTDANGDPQDLTDYTVTVAIAKTNGGTRILRKLSTDASQIALDAPLTLGTGTLYFVPTDFDSGKLDAPGVYYFTAWIDDGTSYSVFDSGTITVTDEVAQGA